MRRTALALCALVVLALQPAGAQAPAGEAAAAPAAAPAARTPSKLPVRRVILYKNGVGYFEHVGRVHGNESVAIDFNSSQLNDVLQSLTTIDLGGGRVAGISYNSETPFAERLGALRLPIGEHTTLPQLLDALRGTRLEVRAGTGTITGRLLGVERKTRGSGADARTVDEMTLVGDAGDVRLVEITPAVTIRLAERDTTEQVGTYLGLLASTRAQDRRRMSIATAGSGDRDLLVSYISEVPVWKTTYRIVLPSRAGAKPLLQGWAIVDNTIGEDWRNVELSLVAGAPQSFIQQISQPLYVQRPVVPLPKTMLLAPQTHEATLTDEAGKSAQVAESIAAAAPKVPVRVGGNLPGAGGGRYVTAPMAASMAPPAPSREEIEQRLADVQSAAQGQELGDLFEYKVSEPISIAKNQSALVPILRSEVTADRVSLWNAKAPGGRPLRSLWLTNSSSLTLDGGSFTVLDAGAFAGEGLVDAMKPGEKRLLSYAVDSGVLVEPRNGDEQRTVTRITIARGILVQHGEHVSRRVYTIRNTDTADRQVVIEHPIRPGWKLTPDGPKPVETSADAYRFMMTVPSGKTQALTVSERQDLGTTYRVADLDDQKLAVLVRDSGNGQALRDALAPVMAKKAALSSIASEVDSRNAELKRIADDQLRVRENMKALKGTAEEQQLVKRYATQLNQQEDRIAVLQREVNDLRQKYLAAEAELAKAIDALTLELPAAAR